MNKIKRHFLFKAVSITLIMAFVALDISWAYPPGSAPKPVHNLQIINKAATPINSDHDIVSLGVSFEQKKTFDTNWIWSVVFSDIASFVFADVVKDLNKFSRRSEGMESSIRFNIIWMRADFHENYGDDVVINVEEWETEADGAYEGPDNGICLGRINPHIIRKGVLVIPFAKDGKRYFAYVPPEGSSAARGIKLIEFCDQWEEFNVEGYVVRILPGELGERDLKTEDALKVDKGYGEEDIKVPVERDRKKKKRKKKSSGILSQVTDPNSLKTIFPLLLIFPVVVIWVLIVRGRKWYRSRKDRKASSRLYEALYEVPQ